MSSDTAARVVLDRAQAVLTRATTAANPSLRFLHAHLAALRIAAAVCAAHGARPALRGRRSVWQTLPQVAPDLETWAVVFAGSAARRSASRRGSSDHLVTASEADALVAQTTQFLDVVRGHLDGVLS